jgi:hypothetical protein
MKPKPPDPSSRFDKDVADIVNAPAIAQVEQADDPVVAPPLTGGWHALVNKVDPQESEHWINGLNVDSRNRAASGLGSRVIRANQERYVREAWEQVGEIIHANRRIAGLRFALFVNDKLFSRHVAPLPHVPALQFTAPVFARVLGSPTTLRGLLNASRLPNAVMSPAFRKLVRPRGLLGRRGVPADVRRDLASRIASAANEGRASAAPAAPPVAGPTIEGVAGRLRPDPKLLWWIANAWWLVLLFVAAGILALALLTGPVAIVAAAVAGAGLGFVAWSWRRASIERAAKARLDLAAAGSDWLPAAPPADFAVTEPGSTEKSPADPHAAADFAEAQRSFVSLVAARPRPAPARPAFDTGLAHAKMMASLRPSAAYPQRAARQLRVGDLAITNYVLGTYADGAGTTEEPAIAPVMAYPDCKEAMYKPLADLSDELMVPNLGLIPPNSISLMLTNPPFIEAYMAGLNHEFARELLWREYPTDCRGSPFRQFWNSEMRPTPGLEGKARANALKDIRPLNEWYVTTPLGSHGNLPGATKEGRVVLVLRGDLLKRYPNTLVYAQRARWSIDPRHKDELALFDEEGEKALAGTSDPNIAYPIFSAFLPADLNLIGFDLSLEEVRGDPTLEENAASRASIAADKLGWFFVVQEVPGEPRLGLDEQQPPPAMRSDYKWDNFSWAHLDMAGRTVIDLALPLASEPDGAVPADRVLNWRSGSGATAADVAAILNQKPVMVAWHARQMLERGKVDEV